MNIGIPKEQRPFEFRVGLSPGFVSLLVETGHTCYIEHNAGLGAGFSDEDYKQAGGLIVYSSEEAFGRADLVLKVSRPTMAEIEMLEDGKSLMGILHMPSARVDKIEKLVSKKLTQKNAPFALR